MMPGSCDPWIAHMGKDIMRPDMHKVIVERPRWGSSSRGKKTGLRLPELRVREALDDADGFDSGSTRASSARRDKGLNENLAPLQRYLERQVGRPWNKVYGEILAGVDTRSAIGLHVLQHIPQLIWIHTYMKDGRVYARQYREGIPVCGLYVHPVTGIVRLIRRRRPRLGIGWYETAPTVVPINQNEWFEKMDGLWYRMQAENRDPSQLKPGEDRFVIVGKRQCDHKTIVKIERGDFGPGQNKGAYLRRRLWCSR